MHWVHGMMMVFHVRMRMMFAVDHDGGMMVFHFVIHHRVFVRAHVALGSLSRSRSHEAECGDGHNRLSRFHHSSFHGVSSGA